MKQHNISLRRDEQGASAVEYGLLIAGMAALIVAIVFVFVFGGRIQDTSSGTCTTVAGAVGTAR